MAFPHFLIGKWRTTPIHTIGSTIGMYPIYHCAFFTLTIRTQLIRNAKSRQFGHRPQRQLRHLPSAHHAIPLPMFIRYTIHLQTFSGEVFQPTMFIYLNAHGTKRRSIHILSRSSGRALGISMFSKENHRKIMDGRCPFPALPCL